MPPSQDDIRELCEQLVAANQASDDANVLRLVAQLRQEVRLYIEQTRRIAESARQHYFDETVVTFPSKRDSTDPAA